MRVLVTGGAGYIGSHTCVELLEAGHEVFVIDNLSNGHEAALNRIRNITNCELGFMNADIRDSNALDEIFIKFKPEAVVHFAGLKAVSESVVEPLKYYNVNVGGSISLLDAMDRADCMKIVFSSSATVYGSPDYLPYDEKHPTCPVNPYGKTKLIVEKLIQDWVSVNEKRKGSSLRYFNPVGAHPSGQIGEDPHGAPNNLMPFISQVASGRREYLQIFGNDYADAHIKTLQCQATLKSFEVLNIGNGKGITVFELIKSFECASGVSIRYKLSPRREGDLPAFWSDASLAFEKLAWKPQLTIDHVCKDTWRWQSNNTRGYNDSNHDDAELSNLN